MNKHLFRLKNSDLEYYNQLLEKDNRTLKKLAKECGTELNVVDTLFRGGKVPLSCLKIIIKALGGRTSKKVTVITPLKE